MVSSDGIFGGSALATGVGIFRSLILPVFALMAGGYVVDRSGRLDLGTLNRLNLYLCIPSLGFTKIYESTVPLVELGAASGMTLALALIMVAAAWGAAAAQRMPVSVRATSAAACSCYNSGNYGRALVGLIFHGAAYPVPLQAVVAATQNLFTFTVGLALVTKGKRTWARSLGVAFRYPFLYFVGGAVLLRLIGIHPAPEPVLVAPAVIIRLIGGPAIMMALLRLLELKGLLAQTLLISSGVPTAVNITVLAIEQETEPELISAITLWTTLFSAITMTTVVYAALHLRG